MVGHLVAAAPPGKRPSRRWRVRTPIVIQMEALECGAACLAIVMGHYGKHVSLEELRVACGVSRDGSRADRIAGAAPHYGFKARAYRMSVDAVLALGKPAIVFWNFNHFLVVEGVRGDVVYLNDPTTGPRPLTRAEFDLGFTGVTLVVEPAAGMQPSGRPRGVVAALWRRLSGYRQPIVYLALVAFCLSLSGVALPLFAKVFIDDVMLGAAGTFWVKPLIAGLAATALLRGLLAVLQQHYLLKFRASLALATASAFLWRLFHLPLSFYQQRHLGEIAARVRLNDDVAQLIVGELASASLNLLAFVCYAILMALLDLQLTAIVMLAAALQVLLLHGLARVRIAGSARVAMDRSRLIETSINGLANIETLRAAGLESEFFARWAGFQARWVSSSQRLQRATVPLLVGPPLLTSIALAAIIMVGGRQVMDGLLSVGELVAFQSLMVSFLQPVAALVAMATQLQELRIGMDRLDDVVQCEAEAAPAAAARPRVSPADKLAGSLELRNITFAYGRLDRPLLQDFNCVIPRGARVALVGPSGCGKSTVARLIMGLYRPWQGEILFDGRPRHDIADAVWFGSVAMIEQDVALFDGSIRDNITLWNDECLPERVEAAAQDACIHDVIVRRNRGYATYLRRGGADLSGGERQRLEIARALAADPTILILDEATSALDPLLEHTIDATIRTRGLTCLIIAHRLSTIRDCDEIIVMERGVIVERGRHEQLLGNGALYARLVASM